MSPFPQGASAQDAFVLERRGPRTPLDPWSAPRMIVEDERHADGHLATVATIFLVGKDCPWRCAMCDLWHGTIDTDTPPGAIPQQVHSAWSRRSAGCVVAKLYNAGSFFDPHAVPDDDYGAVVDALAGARHVIVESHPALVGPRTLRLRDMLRASGAGSATLEVAMGLETCHPEALRRLNKRMTTTDFEGAAHRLRDDDIALRAFLLISPPFIPPADQDAWLGRSIAFAVSCGATAVSLIPTRPGNGTIESLAAEGMFIAPGLADIERSLSLALALVSGSRTRAFVDLWDLGRFARCQSCLPARQARLSAMNSSQTVLPPSDRCGACGAGAWP